MDTKQVIVVRNDLNMRKGKIGAQCCHASMSWLTRRMVHLLPNISEHTDAYAVDYIKLSKAERHWLDHSFAKVCCKVSSEEELLALHARAKELGLESHLVTDEGRTEFKGVPTMTCVAIGPDWCDKIDAVTGDLGLL